MTNKEIANSFKLLGNLLELHGDNAFKIKSYGNAYITLRKIEQPFRDMSEAELMAYPGIGKTIAEKITELLETGTLAALEKVKAITPVGIQEMLLIRGLGPKKVNVLWKELGVESPAELLYACNENRLVALKGFGVKTQEEIRRTLEFFMDNKGQFLYANVIDEGQRLINSLQANWPNHKFELAGDLARGLSEVDGITILTDLDLSDHYPSLGISHDEDGSLVYNNFPFRQELTDLKDFGSRAFVLNSAKEFVDASGFDASTPYVNEVEIFSSLGATFVPAEYRESARAWKEAKSNALPDLVELADILGVVHNHSTYSDGLHSVEEMASYAQTAGYKYLVMSDHSRSAFYAKGLEIDRVEAQWREIDVLNSKNPGFRIFKGIESDILNDGSLDYPDDVLAGFEVVIASIHSNLKMDEAKATARLITAIENPYTRILGHPTGRLLLGRKGYPIDHHKVIDACAANGVVIEMNANPQRLDMDYKYIKYAMEKNVMISINPDAHSKSAIDYIKYGVLAARKGGLTKSMTLNAKDLGEFKAWLTAGK